MFLEKNKMETKYLILKFYYSRLRKKKKINLFKISNVYLKSVFFAYHIPFFAFYLLLNTFVILFERT